jgi:hypothetical protein
VVILAAIGAIFFSWQSRVARSMFIASLIIISFGYYSGFIFANHPGYSAFNLGPWLRIIFSGLVSLFAFTGMAAYFRHT